MKPFLQSIACLIALLMLLPLAAAEDVFSDNALDIETLESEGIEVEGFSTEEDDASSDLTAASIAGLTPLYTTKIKAFVANGSAIRMRALQSMESDVICSVPAGKTITVYAVYPAYVLAEYEGNVGFIIRTWVDEDMTAIDPSATMPYGVVPAKYVATLTETVDIYTEPSLTAECVKVRPGAGGKIAILDFVDGFAKVLFWRQYGYIDATKLTDLVVVSQNGQPASEETPIAAFCSFFEYNTGKEGNEGRCKNILRTCESMTLIMQPGQKLNFNQDVGPYRRANGYFPAPVLINGGSQLGYGGGTCQSSSTLYNAVRQVEGVTILYRRPHGPGCAKYLPMHQDAAVGSDSLNFIFQNDGDTPIRILSETTGEGVLCIQVFRVNQ